MHKRLPLILTFLLTAGPGLNIQPALASPPKAPNVDSLRQIVKSARADTARIKALIALSQHMASRNPDTAASFARQALESARTINWQKGKARASEELGKVYHRKSDYTTAIKHLQNALQTWRALNNKVGEAEVLKSMGLAHASQGNFNSAIENYFEALNLYKKIDRPLGAASVLNDIALSYEKIDNYQKALQHYSKALALKKKGGSRKDIAITQLNIGVLYYQMEKYLKALDYYQKCHKTARHLNNPFGLSLVYNNLGELYMSVYQSADSIKKAFLPRAFPQHFTPRDTSSQKVSSKLETSRLVQDWDHILLDSALVYHQRALQIRHRIQNKKGIASSLTSIGRILLTEEQYGRSLPYFQRAYRKAVRIHSLVEKKQASRGMYLAYKHMGQTDSALYWHERYMKHSDSFVNLKKQQQLGRQEARFEWKQKLIQQQEEQEQQQAIQYTIIAFISGGLLLALIFALFLYRQFRVTRHQNQVIEKQKDLVDQKNEEIISSINYAQRIQSAMLKAKIYLKQEFPDQHFVLFRPKEAVSGDFYWAFQEGNRFYATPYQKGTQFFWSVADCTGHGIPGAFMSMIGNMLLNECTVVKEMKEPAPILEDLRAVIEDTLQIPDKEEQMQDGMDMTLCVLNTETNRLKFAGAKNSLYLIREASTPVDFDFDRKVEGNNHILYEIKGDPHPVGFEETEPEPFQQSEIQVHPGDTLYTFSDGYPDQFGGPRGKKFMYKQFRQLLLSIQDKPMPEQKKILDDTITDWMARNDEEQIDDICVMGIRI